MLRLSVFWGTTKCRWTRSNYRGWTNPVWTLTRLNPPCCASFFLLGHFRPSCKTQFFFFVSKNSNNFIWATEWIKLPPVGTSLPLLRGIWRLMESSGKHQILAIHFFFKFKLRLLESVLPLTWTPCFECLMEHTLKFLTDHSEKETERMFHTHTHTHTSSHCFGRAWRRENLIK